MPKREIDYHNAILKDIRIARYKDSEKRKAAHARYMEDASEREERKQKFDDQISHMDKVDVILRVWDTPESITKAYMKWKGFDPTYILKIEYICIIHETPKAYHIQFAPKKRAWIPKSITKISRVNRTVFMSTKLAEIKGIRDLGEVTVRNYEYVIRNRRSK